MFIYVCVCVCAMHKLLFLTSFVHRFRYFGMNSLTMYVCMYFNVPATFPLIQRERHERSSDCAVVASRESVFVKVNGYQLTNIPLFAYVHTYIRADNNILYMCT